MLIGFALLGGAWSVNTADVASAQASPAYPTPADRDQDGLSDPKDACPASPGDLPNGCPSRLQADVRGGWRANALFSQLLFLTVKAQLGSRIVLHCAGKRGVCGFKTRTIRSTTKLLTGLTRYFKGRRVFRAGTTITVRVTRSRQIGLYERVVTQRGRRLPRVVNRCISTKGVVSPCSSA
ncbi:MAG TPA: hypothetical protein VD867_18585 [Burkholderiales bacterium]|nr:hypothetical protein [Burkholderiales bacterium]